MTRHIECLITFYRYNDENLLNKDHENAFGILLTDFPPSFSQ